VQTPALVPIDPVIPKTNDQTSIPERSRTRNYSSGTISTSLIVQLDAVLICEKWPAWIVALSALCMNCSHIYLSSLQAVGKLSTVFPRFKFLPLSCLSPSPAPNTLYFVSCSPPWVAELYRTYVLPFCVISLLHGHHLTLPGFTSEILDSVSCGSVVTRQYQILFRGGPTSPVGHPHTYQRVLRHIVNPREHVPRTFDGALPGHHPLRTTENLPAYKPLTLVSCPCSFDASGWRVRPLSGAELGRAFDIMPALTAAYSFSYPVHLPWLKAPPSKLLVHIGLCFVQTVGGVLSSVGLTGKVENNITFHGGGNELLSRDPSSASKLYLKTITLPLVDNPSPTVSSFRVKSDSLDRQ
jgi:hypothetical protein